MRHLSLSSAAASVTAMSSLCLAVLLISIAPARAKHSLPLLSTGKIITPAGTSQASSGILIPGDPTHPGPVIGSLPMNIILDPTGRYAIVSGMGFREYLSAINTHTGDLAQPVTGHTPIVLPTPADHHEHPSTDPISPSSITFGEQHTGSNGLYYGLALTKDPQGGSTIYASQGSHSSIAVVHLSSHGALTQTGEIRMQPGDFPAGLALDRQGNLYAAVNEFDTRGEAIQDATTPGSMVVYDTKATGVITSIRAKTQGAAPEITRIVFNGPQDTFGSYLIPTSRPPRLAPLTPSNFPYAVAVTPNGRQVFVSSQRDGGIFVITHSGNAWAKKFIPTGAHPDSLLMHGHRLYVANASSDTVSVLNTLTDQVMDTILLRPTGTEGLPGVTPTGLALSPSTNTLYVTLGDMNAVGVINVSTDRLTGYIPTGWYPSAVAVVQGSHGQDALLVTNAKGIHARNPNPEHITELPPPAPKYDDVTYDENIIEGNVSRIDMGAKGFSLTRATQHVMQNNKIAIARAALMPDPINPLADVGLQAGKIRHVIYIIKENRTYDQVLGDDPRGNGDPALAIFGKSVTPNEHALADRFVLLDNFYDCSEVSADGWPWSTQGMANEYIIKNVPYNYSGRGRQYDSEGQNNGLLVGGFPAKDMDGKPLSTLFPLGQIAIGDVAESPGGHIWNDAKKAGLSYRNYGFFESFGKAGAIPDNYPNDRSLQPPGHYTGGPLNPAANGLTDYDFRRFDLSYADSNGPEMTGHPYPTAYYGNFHSPSRFAEFNRELQLMIKAGKAVGQDDKYVPNLILLRLMSDHTGGYSAGKPTPVSHVADNDYAVGEVVQAVSADPELWKSTAICILEDDSQDGPDHVDCHRSTAFVISPYIKKGTIDHRFYNTDSMLRTIEDLLGLPPMTEYDAIASPILDFTPHAAQNDAPYTAILAQPGIIGQMAENPIPRSSPFYHLAQMTAQMDLKRADRAPEQQLNQVDWQSVKGPNSPLPAPRRTLNPIDK